MILIADSGSTKTDWVAWGTEVPAVRFQSVGFNPFYQTEAVILEALQHEVLPQVPTASHIFFYGAGCADEQSARPVWQALRRSFPGAPVEVNSDLLAAARALCGHEAGIACILGTGANNCLYDGTRILNNVGSLGFWMGDEGSGGYLGKTLVVRFLHKELPPEIHERFASAYPEIDRFSVLENAYKKPFPNRYFATFTRFLSDNLPHPYIRQLIREAFGVFLEKYVLKHPDAPAYPVHFTGSVAYYFRELLAEAVAEKELRMGTIQKSPMEGLLRYHGID
ncbi:N-acetylglucosamine kinase [Telluribacter sp.]|jgi:N-acetylglucosamine kinase-like BadF-type ATPase|uniref:N-acetylglucosamine kinase n=1 Tax=Telluribacter sp. TaxID=1978767 RepID=UPI002E14FB69|nr:N-acetylglucosamine kinase [Telluribacter sp.]